MEEYLFLLDGDIKRGLMGIMTCVPKQQKLWAAIKIEEDRVAGYKKDFPCEFRITIRPQVAWLPCIGQHLSFNVKVEGEAEREWVINRWKVWPHMKLWAGNLFKPIISPA